MLIHKTFAESRSGSAAALCTLIAVLVAAPFVTFVAAPAHADCLPQWNPAPGQPGMNDRINAIITFDDGKGGGPVLVAGGNFTTAGGISVPHVAKWTGTEWQSIGSSMPMSSVLALAVFDHGDGPELYASGSGSASLVRWTGSQWTPVPNAPNAWLGTLHVHDVGDGPELYVSGGFGGFPTIDGPTDYIARWNGSQWRSVGGGLVSVVHEFATFDAGSGEALYAIGSFAFFNPPSQIVIGFGTFDGENWSGAGGGFNGGNLNALKRHDDGSGPALFAAGGFTAAGGTSTFGGAIPANRIAKWNGREWAALGSGLNNTVNALVVFDADGEGPAPADLIVAGDFTTAGGVPANRIAKWDGSTWAALGGGLNASVQTMAVSPDGGTLVIGGDFTTAGGDTANRIATWACAPRIIGDINGDLHVDIDDLLAVIQAWGPCPAPCPADVAPEVGDGLVNIDDLLLVISNWGA